MYKKVLLQKSTTELFKILNDKSKYKPEAISEVISILKERGELDKNYNLTIEKPEFKKTSKDTIRIEKFVLTLFILLLISFCVSIGFGGGYASFISPILFSVLIMFIPNDLLSKNFIGIILVCCFGLIINDSFNIRMIGFGVYDAQGRGVVNLLYFITFSIVTVGLTFHSLVAKVKMKEWSTLLTILILTLGLTFIYDHLIPIR